MKIISVFLLIAVAVFSFAPVALAEASIDTAVDKIGRGFDGVDGGSDPDVKTRELVGKGINLILGIIGTIALLVFLYSGIMWMLAGGNDQNITKAQNAMIWAALGLFVVFISYAIITYLIKRFTF